MPDRNILQAKDSETLTECPDRNSQGQTFTNTSNMEFNSNKAIYLQICDAICEKILGGLLLPDARIPSVREYGSEIGVNPNTVMRSYEKLTNEGIIYNKRGIGYFIASDARERIIEQQRKEFTENEMPQIIRKMNLLGIEPSILIEKIEESKSCAD